MFHYKLFGSAMFIVLVGSFHVGFQSASSNGASVAINSFLFNATGTEATLLFSVYSSSRLLMGVFGAISAAPLADKFGRKSTLVATCVVQLVMLGLGTVGASIVSAFGVVLLFVARLGMGAMTTGLGLTLQALILSEISPTHLRGSVIAMSGTAIHAGFTVGFMVASPSVLGTDALWSYLFVVEAAIVAVDLLGLMFICHESPFWLVMHQKINQARAAVGFYHSKSKDDAALVVRDIIAELNTEKQPLSTKVMSLTEIMKDPIVRKGLLTGSAVCITLVFSGVMAMGFFCVQLLADTGFDNATAANITIGIYSICLISNVTASIVIDKFGRKPLLVSSCVGCVIGHVIMMVMGLVNQKYNSYVFGYIFIAAEIIFFSSLGFGIGPLALSYTVELVPQRAKAKCQSINMIIQHFLSFVSPIIFWELHAIVGFYAFLLFIIPLCASSVFCCMYVVETKNKTIGEIQAAMGAAQPDMKMTEQAISKAYDKTEMNQDGVANPVFKK